MQTPNSDRNWQTSCPLQTFVCKMIGVHCRTGSPGQLGLRVAGVAGSQNVTQFHVWYRLRRQISVSRQLLSRVGTWLARHAQCSLLSPLTYLRNITLRTTASSLHANHSVYGVRRKIVEESRRIRLQLAFGGEGKVFNATKSHTSSQTCFRKIALETTTSN